MTVHDRHPETAEEVEDICVCGHKATDHYDGLGECLTCECEQLREDHSAEPREDDEPDWDAQPGGVDFF